MVDGARIREFRSHWQHEPNPTEEFQRFRARVREVSRQLWDEYFRDEDQKYRRERFAVISGTSYSYRAYFQESGLLELLESAKTIFQIANAVQALLWAAEEVLPNHAFEHCCREIERALDLSPTIMIRLVSHGRTATLYPTGAKLLDEAAVEGNLAWLGRYPAVLKPFEDALRIYLTKDPKQYRGMLDSLRFAVEQMVQIVLKNQRSLENQKEEFGRWLKDHGVHAQIRGMYHDLLFDGFAKYQNDAVKHQEDQYTSAEVEFVLYLTGTFLRLIQRLTE
jgi:hypothetical protein